MCPVFIVRLRCRSLGDDQGDSDARLSFLGSSDVCSDMSAHSVVGLGAKVLELTPVLGVSYSDGAGVVH